MTCGYLVTVAYTAALYVRDIASKQRLLLTVFHVLVSVDSRHMHVLSGLISSRVHVYIAAGFEVALTPAMLQPYVQRISSKQSCKNALLLAKNAQCFVEARPNAVAICCVSCPEHRSRQLMLRKCMDHTDTALLFETQNNITRIPIRQVVHNVLNAPPPLLAIRVRCQHGPTHGTSTKVSHGQCRTTTTTNRVVRLPID